MGKSELKLEGQYMFILKNISKYDLWIDFSGSQALRSEWMVTPEAVPNKSACVQLHKLDSIVSNESSSRKLLNGSPGYVNTHMICCMVYIYTYKTGWFCSGKCWDSYSKGPKIGSTTGIDLLAGRLVQIRYSHLVNTYKFDMEPISGVIFNLNVVKVNTTSTTRC